MFPSRFSALLWVAPKILGPWGWHLVLIISLHPHPLAATYLSVKPTGIHQWGVRPSETFSVLTLFSPLPGPRGLGQSFMMPRKRCVRMCTHKRFVYIVSWINVSSIIFKINGAGQLKGFGASFLPRSSYNSLLCPMPQAQRTLMRSWSTSQKRMTARKRWILSHRNQSHPLWRALTSCQIWKKWVTWDDPSCLHPD